MNNKKLAQTASVEESNTSASLLHKLKRCILLEKNPTKCAIIVNKLSKNTLKVDESRLQAILEQKKQVNSR